MGMDICCLEGRRAGCLAGCLDGALAGVLPRTLEPVLKSRMSWLPAFMTGFGVEGTGGLVNWPPLLKAELLGA